MPALMLDLGLLVGGLVLLTYAADRFVLGCSWLSSLLRLSPVIIGAVIIGFGTSTPEFVVTILAVLEGAQDLALGNIVGSNTANVLLVLGAAGLVHPLAVRHATLRRELPLMLASVALLSLVAFNRLVTTVEALILLGGAAGVLALMLQVARRDRDAATALEVQVAEYEGRAAASLWKVLTTAVLGLVGTLVGAQMLVQGATGLAEAAGLSEAVIGLTIVAVGTSLPELVTAVAAARREETELVIGNVLGSNIFNSLPVAGVAGLLDTVRLDAAFPLSLALMVVACGLVALFLRTGRCLARGEAGFLLVGFLLATFVVIVS